MKPFIPEYVPAIGDIDAFLKVPRPDGKSDSLGLVVLDEPSSRQSDPHVLNLQMRYTSKQPIAASLPTVRHPSHFSLMIFIVQFDEFRLYEPYKMLINIRRRSTSGFTILANYKRRKPSIQFNIESRFTIER